MEMVNYKYYATIDLLVRHENIEQLPEYLPKFRESIARMVPTIEELRRKLLPEHADLIAEMLADHQRARHLYTRAKRLIGRAVRHRGYAIRYNPKPIPDRRHDWEFVHADYDGPGDPRCGTGASAYHCQYQINKIEEQRKRGVA